MSSIFTKIVNGEIPCYKIAEDENHLAFLDVMPLVKGHTLVIPKKEIDFIFDLDSEDYKNLWGFAQEVAKNGQILILLSWLASKNLIWAVLWRRRRKNCQIGFLQLHNFALQL